MRLSSFLAVSVVALLAADNMQHDPDAGEGRGLLSMEASAQRVQPPTVLQYVPPSAPAPRAAEARYREAPPVAPAPYAYASAEQAYVREPHVTVEVETYRPFFILGEVTTPGQYPYVADMTVEKAIAIAGGFSPRAFKTTVELTRSAPGQQFKGDVPL